MGNTPLPKNLEDNTIQFENTKYGNFKQILNGNIVNYKFKDDHDMTIVNENAQFIYAGYGYSGSGKTHTLINDTNSILKQIFETENNITLEVTDLYGEIIAEKSTNLTSDRLDLFTKCSIDEKFSESFKYGLLSKNISHEGVLQQISYYTYNENKIGHTNSTNKIYLNAENIDSFYKDLTNYRKNAANYSTNFNNETFYNETFYNENTKEPARYRVRATPNNPESSRSHLFIKVYVGGKHKYTIIDMGGTENVEQIQNDYFQDSPMIDIEALNDTTIP